ncbi:MAG: hypothetical protein ACREXS_21070 [Gammaproteobacteria bacterium]
MITLLILMSRGPALNQGSPVHPENAAIVRALGYRVHPMQAARQFRAVSAHHWPITETPVEVRRAIEDWLCKRFA